MITAVRPYAVQNRQQQNFCAVKPEWVKKLVENPVSMINKDFGDAVAWGDISPKDAVDTLKVAKERLKGKFQGAFDRTIKWAANYQCPVTTR